MYEYLMDCVEDCCTLLLSILDLVQSCRWVFYMMFYVGMSRLYGARQTASDHEELVVLVFCAVIALLWCLYYPPLVRTEQRLDDNGQVKDVIVTEDQRGRLLKLIVCCTFAWFLLWFQISPFLNVLVEVIINVYLLEVTSHEKFQKIAFWTSCGMLLPMYQPWVPLCLEWVYLKSFRKDMNNNKWFVYSVEGGYVVLIAFGPTEDAPLVKQVLVWKYILAGLGRGAAAKFVGT